MFFRLLAVLSLTAALSLAIAATNDDGIIIDPNGGAASIDVGCGIDPNGGCGASTLDRGLGLDPNG